MKLVYNVNDKPPIGKLIVFSLQQLMSILAATILVPLLIGGGLTPAAALCGAGLGTLLYMLITKGKSPAFLGSSSARDQVGILIQNCFVNQPSSGKTVAEFIQEQFKSSVDRLQYEYGN